MGDIKGFLKIKRESTKHRKIEERLKDFKEVLLLRSEEKSKEQGSRCMDCGTPFCHLGCPLANVIPEWNDLIFRGQWKKAFEILESTNNFPEVTGRICPALCEFACVLGINDDPVTIRENELDIIEYAFKQGIIKPHPPKKRSGKKVAVIGSGPAGLACAAQLNKFGHTVTVFEKDDKAGGILRYGIPDFKLEKWVLDRRINLLKKEGVIFKTNAEAGSESCPIEKFLPKAPACQSGRDSPTAKNKEFDAVCLAVGSREPRDLKIEGRNLSGIYFAMDYLIQSNQRINGEKIESDKIIEAKDKKVIVIGGGDTGADCVGTAHRQGAASVTQIEILPKPPQCRSQDMPWPKYPMILKTSTSHEEGGEREWSVLTKSFKGKNNHVSQLCCVKIESGAKDEKGCPVIREIKNSDFCLEADLVILALGFLQPAHKGLLDNLGLEYDSRGNIKTNSDYASSVEGVFAAGDAHRGQSLVVWAISEGRLAAEAIDKYLKSKEKSVI